MYNCVGYSLVNWFLYLWKQCNIAVNEHDPVYSCLSTRLYTYTIVPLSRFCAPFMLSSLPRSLFAQMQRTLQVKLMISSFSPVRLRNKSRNCKTKRARVKANNMERNGQTRHIQACSLGSVHSSIQKWLLRYLFYRK